MTRYEEAGPLSRIVSVDRLKRSDGRLIVTASPEECAALAADFGIPSIQDLVGTFETSGQLSAFRVRGTVAALVTQVCTVTLEPFEGPVSESVDLLFTGTDRLEGTDAEDADIPDPIVGGKIDFGTITAEFLALGLDPYPRKPGVAFEPHIEDADEGPLAALRGLKSAKD
ncbi:metal-binding protein [Methylobacterium sp. Leaf113]|uniref:YceD family protein n=1 Tax=Methylobacterium sp. Leaf113 TaxID=1736259 RepID=UPI0006FDB1C8|nr:DUF177 domain-containing protein [Methylobacterium sp. Leaf113]KQP91065.1 metal-binding protein [Methylobacterium sp. Leaf113]